MTSSNSTPSSPYDRLIPSSAVPSISTATARSTYSITLNPLYVIRIFSTVLSIATFIIFVIDGGNAFIASDIFLAFIMIYNALMVLQSITDVFKITVELRGAESESWRHDVGGGRKKTKPNGFLDVGLAACLLVCLIVGNACISRWHGGGAWHVAVVLGWFVVILQALLAVPALESKSLTLTAKLNDLNEKAKLDTKLPFHAPATAGREVNGEEVRPTAEDLV